MSNHRGTLTASNRIVTCRGCGKRTHSSIEGNLGIELCHSRLEDSGWENEHSDGHNAEHVDSNCPYCVKAGWVK